MYDIYKGPTFPLKDRPPKTLYILTQNPVLISIPLYGLCLRTIPFDEHSVVERPEVLKNKLHKQWLLPLGLEKRETQKYSKFKNEIRLKPTPVKIAC